MEWSDRFAELMRNPSGTAGSEDQLREIVENYPFFQAARYLYVERLHERMSVAFDKELNMLALHTNDRELLFRAFGPLTEKETVEAAPVLTGRLSPFFSMEGLPDSTEQDELILETGRQLVPDVVPVYDLEREYTMPTSKGGDKQGDQDTEKEESQKPQSRNKSRDVIDRFLRGETGKTKASVQPPLEEDEEAFKVPTDLVSETLAKIYIKQEKYAEAIAVYEKLALSEPEKKAYFARLIEDLKKKQ